MHFDRGVVFYLPTLSLVTMRFRPMQRINDIGI